MKKRILSFLILILLLSFIAVPSACAEAWVSLGTWSIGQNVSFQLTAYAFDDNVNAVSVGGDIPAGCTIDRSYSSDTGEYGLVLNGLLNTAGDYTFQIVIDGEVNNYSMTVISEDTAADEEPAGPEIPSISVLSAPATCAVGSTTVLSIGASVSDDGFLSYQWYRNGEIVFGGNDSSISIATTSPGVFSFHCEVTNTLNGASVSATSDEILVEVQDSQAQATISQISILSQPTKITYKAGESLDTSGLVIQTIDSTGKTTNITSGFNVSPAQFSSNDIGVATVTVTYGGQTCSFQVNVESNTRTLSVVTMPNKAAYETGDTLDTTGLQLCLTNGTDKKYIQSDFSCSPLTLSTPGTQMITVSYDGLTCTFNVSVKARQTSQLKVKTLPSKTTYLVGEALNTEGLVIEIISGTAASTQTITSGFVTEPAVLTKAGQQTVTVSYDNLTTTFTVNVSETATPAPTEVIPTQDAAAQAATAAANAAVNARNEQNHRTGLIIFIAVVAVFALLILGVYVYLAKADNIEETLVGKLIQRLMDKTSK